MAQENEVTLIKDFMSAYNVYYQLQTRVLKEWMYSFVFLARLQLFFAHFVSFFPSLTSGCVTASHASLISFDAWITTRMVN